MPDPTDAERAAALSEMFGSVRDGEPQTPEAGEAEPTQADQTDPDVELLRQLHADPEPEVVPESMLRREQALVKANLPTRLAPLLEDSEDDVQLFMAARELGRELGVKRVSVESALIDPGTAPDPQPQHVVLARKALAHAAMIRQIHGGDGDQ